MRRHRNRSFTPYVFTLLLLVATTTAAATTTITYYMATGQEDWAAWTRETAKLFEAQHPDVRVEVMLGNMEQLLVMAAGGIYPDIIHLDGGSLPEYAELFLLHPLDELVANDPEFDTDAFFPALMDAMYWKGQMYVLPRAWGAVALVYNRGLMDAAGVPYPDETWTWDDLVTNGRKLTTDQTGDGNPDVFGFYDSWANGNRFPLWIWQAGGDIWNEDFTQVRIANAASVQGLQFYYDVYYTHRIAPRIVGGQPYNEPGIPTANQDDLFRMGKVAMVHATRYFTPDEVDWDVAPLAKGPAGRHTMLIPSVAGISANSAHVDTAWEFLKFFVSDEGFLAGDNLKPMRSTYLGAIPPTIDLARERLSQRGDLQEHMWVITAEQGRVNNLNNPFTPLNGRTETGNLFNAVARQEIPLDTALHELADRWQRVADSVNK